MFTEVFVDVTCWNATRRRLQHTAHSMIGLARDENYNVCDVTSQKCPRGMEASGGL